MTLAGIVFMSLGIIFFSASFGFALYKVLRTDVPTSNKIENKSGFED